MCRHFAFVSPAPVRLGDPLVDAPHSLERQARAPKHQTSGDENPDGWGVGWFDDEGRIQRYRSAVSIWVDPAVAELSDRVHTTSAMAAVRLASPGASIVETGSAPFTDGEWLFSLNGIVDGFFDGVGDELRSLTTQARLDRIEGDADTEVLFAMALDALDAGASPGDALLEVVHRVDERTSGRLNLLLTDGRIVAATAWGNSLFRDDTYVASEPLDDAPGWSRVPDRSVTVIKRDGIEPDEQEDVA
jgi:glutamine amidotransferase